jgi:hypothetical protein
MDGARIYHQYLGERDAALASQMHELTGRLVSLAERQALADERLGDVRRLRRSVGHRVQAPLGVEGQMDHRFRTLLPRTFDFDVRSCPKCGGRLEVRAVVTEPESAAKILESLARNGYPP